MVNNLIAEERTKRYLLRLEILKLFIATSSGNSIKLVVSEFKIEFNQSEKMRRIKMAKENHNNM